MIPLLVIGLALTVSTTMLEPAAAQTALGGKSPPVSATPPGKAASSPPPQVVSTPPAKAASMPTAQGTRPQAPAVPVPETMAAQAELHAEGLYTEMNRPGAGGQIQEAWDLAEPRSGVYVTRACVDCVYKVRTRELMTTTVILPKSAVIADAQLGDPVGFSAQVKTANMIAVRPNGYGLDTNLTVTTKTGDVYPFYVRSESLNSIHVPDLVVRIMGDAGAQTISGLPEAAPETGKPTPADPKLASAIQGLTTPGAAKGDFVRTVPFDPAKLHGWKDYKLSGDSELKPETVFRDDFFTYIQYGDKWDGMELSSAYVTIDGIDELVNSRVQGNTFIVESVSPLITLKNGKRFLCIKYTGAKP